MPIPRLSPQQVQQLQDLTSQAGSGVQNSLGRLNSLASGDESAFKDLEAPAYSAFQKGLGQLGSRFAGFGALGSSAFQNATSGATSDLAQQLQANRLGIQNDSIDRLLQLYQMLLGNQTAEDEQDFDWSGLLGMLGRGAGGAIAGGLTGGPLGAGLGALGGLGSR